MGALTGIVTIVALLTFLAIVIWAFSKGRKNANKDASMLPFMQPDEGELKDTQKKTPGQQDKGDSHD